MADRRPAGAGQEHSPHPRHTPRPRGIAAARSGRARPPPAGRVHRVWWRGLFVPAALLLMAFALWEGRTAARGWVPLLDPQLARTAGFPTGSTIALVYFTGFTGIWVVLALFFQNGLGYTPLHSGLAVTPFAIGSAVSAVFAGRAVPRFGRRLT